MRQRIFTVGVLASVAMLFLGGLGGPAQAAETSLSFGGCISKSGAGGACVAGLPLLDVRSVTVSPDGKHAYAASFGDDAVVVFNRNPDTGALSYGSCHSETGAGGCVNDVALVGATSVTVSPDNKNVYVASHESGAVVVFTRNTSTGALSFASCYTETATPGCGDTIAMDGARSVTVSPNGEQVYIASDISDTVVVFNRNTNTGALTPASCISDVALAGCITGSFLNGAQSVVVSADGESAYVASFSSDAVATFTRDLSTGALAYVGHNTDALDGATSVTVSPDSKSVYATSGLGGAVVRFDRDTTSGALTFAGCFSETGAGGCIDSIALVGAQSVTVSPDGKNIYVTSYGTGANGDGAVVGFDRNTATGALTDAGCISPAGIPGCATGKALERASSVVVSPDGYNAYVAAAGASAIVDLNRRTEVFRFWSPRFNNAHFFTASKTEADNLKANDPNWNYEGIAFKGRTLSSGPVSACLSGGSPVYRFYSATFASHFYTSSTTERDALKSGDPNWSYEGPAYCAFTSLVAGTIPLHRFWSPVFHKHFFTANTAEADQLKNHDPNWTYEGIAYYVLP